jgi:hypothetical protein
MAPNYSFRIVYKPANEPPRGKREPKVRRGIKTDFANNKNLP